jgi:hypothetical protein
MSAYHPTAAQVRMRARAGDHRAEIRRRARRIRRSVASLAAVLFSAAFLVIYVQLASGHDPALEASARRAATASTVTTGSSTTKATSSEATAKQTEAETTETTARSGSGSSSGSTESSTSSGSSGNEQTSKSATAVTTSQS